MNLAPPPAAARLRLELTAFFLNRDVRCCFFSDEPGVLASLLGVQFRPVLLWSYKKASWVRIRRVEREKPRGLFLGEYEK